MRALIILFLALLPWQTGASCYPPVPVQVQAVKLGEHSYYIPGLSGAAAADNAGFMSNAGFVVTAEGVVVLDALGSPSLAEVMVREIRKVTPLPIRRVIVSHYHADHYYGIQVFKDLGAEIWAHAGARGVLQAEGARARFAQRKEVLAPWISDELQRFHEADHWLYGDFDFVMGGVHFQLRHVGPAHSAEDMAMFVVEDQVLYAGDLVFQGRVPFVGDADSKQWLQSLDKLLALQPRILVPGHGGASQDPVGDLTLTRDYLTYLRQEMGKAVADLIPFDDAYLATDWSKYQFLPAFTEGNRGNAFNTYILMEREALRRGE